MIGIGRTEAGALRVEGLTHAYGSEGAAVPALCRIDFAAEAGRFLVIVGPSGCGKSSLLLMMAGLRHPSAGRILCAGRPVTGPDPDRIGVVFQEANLFPSLTALDNVAFPLMLRRIPAGERRQRAGAMLRLVGLEGFDRRYPHELSGECASACRSRGASYRTRRCCCSTSPSRLSTSRHG